EMEKLSSSHPDRIHFPDLYFFEPEIVIRLNEKEIMIEADEPEKVFENIDSLQSSDFSAAKHPSIQNRISKEEYLSIIRQLQQHILRGDCYEINFCREFFAENANIDPVQVYKRLSTVSPNPFSALYKLNDQWLICASPERYIKKQ